MKEAWKFFSNFKLYSYLIILIFSGCSFSGQDGASLCDVEIEIWSPLTWLKAAGSQGPHLGQLTRLSSHISNPPYRSRRSRRENFQQDYPQIIYFVASTQHLLLSGTCAQTQTRLTSQYYLPSLLDHLRRHQITGQFLSIFRAKLWLRNTQISLPVVQGRGKQGPPCDRPAKEVTLPGVSDSKRSGTQQADIHSAGSHRVAGATAGTVKMSNEEVVQASTAMRVRGSARQR